MASNTSILDLGPWGSVLGPVFTQALNPATPARVHRELAEQATEYLEQGALLGDNAPDAEIAWRALRTEDLLFVALENGFALAQFDGANLVKLRVETFEGWRWSILHTGRGMAAFRSAALGTGTGGGSGPVMKIALFKDQQVVFGHVFHPNGGETADEDLQRALVNPAADASGHGLTPGTGFGGTFAAALVDANALVTRKAVAHRAARPGISAPPPPVSPMVEPTVQAAPVAVPPVPTPLPPPPPPPQAAPMPEVFTQPLPEPVPTPIPTAALPRPSLPQPPPTAVQPPPPPTPARLPPSAWSIVGMNGPMEGKTLPVLQLSVIGRDPEVDIPIDDRTASRRHAELRPTEVGLVLRDLDSSNGTWMGEQCLDGPVLLKSGDIFSLGDCSFRVQRNGL